MNTITATTLFVAGIYLVIIGQVLTTKNLRSAFLFKVLPTLIGFACFVVALKVVEWF